MNKLIVYDDGSTLFVDKGITLNFTDKKILDQVDTTKATLEEIASLRKNPNNHALIAKIKGRG